MDVCGVLCSFLRVSWIQASFVTLGFVDSVLPKVLELHNIVLGKGGGDWCSLSLMCQTLCWELDLQIGA